MKDTPATSTSSGKSTESAQVRRRLLLERLGELMSDFHAFDQRTESLSGLSCEDSHGVPLSLSPASDSQAA